MPRPPHASKDARDRDVELELAQDIHTLRHRKGDTGASSPVAWALSLTNKERGPKKGSILWRVSVALAKLVLAEHFYPPPVAVVPSLSALRVLELGSGTGFLACVLAPLVRAWTCTDQEHNVRLARRNVSRVAPAAQVEYEHLDWLDARPAMCATTTADDDDDYDLVLACDTIYNAPLAEPLARTITAQKCSTALVANELRDSETAQLFASSMLRHGWQLHRLILDDGYSALFELASPAFALWLATR